jgi:hypothetical protein
MVKKGKLENVLKEINGFGPIVTINAKGSSFREIAAVYAVTAGFSCSYSTIVGVLAHKYWYEKSILGDESSMHRDWMRKDLKKVAEDEKDILLALADIGNEMGETQSLYELLRETPEDEEPNINYELLENLDKHRELATMSINDPSMIQPKVSVYQGLEGWAVVYDNAMFMVDILNGQESFGPKDLKTITEGPSRIIQYRHIKQKKQN